MYYLPLSQEQKSLFARLNHRSISCLSYADFTYKTETLSLWIYRKAIDQKKTIIASNDRDQLEAYRHQFRKLGLEDWILDISNERQISPNTIAKLRAVIKTKHAPLDTIAHQREVAAQNLRLENLKTGYRALHQKVLGARSWKELAEQLQVLHHSDSSNRSLYSLDGNLEVNLQEYFDIRSRIKKAAQLFEFEYNHLETINEIQQEAYLKGDGSALYLFMMNISDELSDIQQELHSFLHNKRQALHKKYQHFKAQIANLIDALRIEAKIEHPIVQNQSDKGWFRKSNKKESDLNIYQKIYEHYDLLRSESSNYRLSHLFPDITLKNKSDLTDFADQLELKLNQWKKLTDILIKDHVRSLNHLNSGDEKVNGIIGHLNELLERLNESKYLKYSQENTTNNLMALDQYISNLLDTLLDQCQLINKYPDYVHWKQYVAKSSELERNIIHKMKLTPQQEWLHSFDTWYFECCLEAKGSFRMEELQPSLQEFIDANDRIKTRYNEIMSSKLGFTRNEAIEHLKNYDPNLYSDLFKKKIIVDALSAKLTAHPTGFLTALYPIIFVSHEQLKHIQEAERNIAHALIVEDINELKIPIKFNLDRFVENCILCEPTSNPMDKDHEMAHFRKEEFCSTLAGTSYHVKEEISKLPNNEKYSTARRLAKNLLLEAPETRVIQGKDVTLISLVSDFKLEKYISDKNWKGLQELKNEDMLNYVVECLLATEKQQILLIEDGLINNKNMDTITWQINLIKKMHSAGIEIIDLRSIKRPKNIKMPSAKMSPSSEKVEYIG